MPRLKSSNFAVTTLAEEILDVTGSPLSFEVANSSAFPDLAAGEAFIIIIHDNTPGFAGVMEIMEVGGINKTTHVLSAVTRAREGTGAQTHAIGARVECAWTAGTYNRVVNSNDVVIGAGTGLAGDNAVVVGRNAKAGNLGAGTGDNHIAIGRGATTQVTSASNLENMVAIGYNAEATVANDFILGNASNNVKVPGSFTSYLKQVEKTAAASTLALADTGKLIMCFRSTAMTLELPSMISVAFPIGTQILVSQTGDGQVTLIAAGDALLYSAGARYTTVEKYSVASLIKIGADTWLLSGDLEV